MMMAAVVEVAEAVAVAEHKPSLEYSNINVSQPAHVLVRQAVKTRYAPLALNQQS